MSLSPAIRSRRRSAGQLHALATLQREIQATDPNGRRKYLRDFAEAYCAYEQILTHSQLHKRFIQADLLVVGDYHALPRSQEFAANLVRELRAAGRKVVLGVEFIFARDQHILDEWMSGEIDSDELRQRIRYDLDWGYEWRPFLEVLEAGRESGAVYGLDCPPRDDLRKIAARDRHAAAKLQEIRQKHPEAAVVALFGESHLAPNHLPLEIRRNSPGAGVLTVLQNVDELYWKAAGERIDHVRAVQVAEDVVCVFNATPLEKYESYRFCIERWRQERRSAPDLEPTVYNLVDALARFLRINTHSAHNGSQPQYLVDRLPEVYSILDEEQLRRVLVRKRVNACERQETARRLADHGCAYVSTGNLLVVREFEMGGGAEEVARFLHAVFSGPAYNDETVSGEEEAAEQSFYRTVVEEALAFFGSRIIDPSRQPVREPDLYALYAQPREAIETPHYSYREFMQMVDFLVLHKDWEANLRHYFHPPQLLREGLRVTGERFVFITQRLGRMLGTELHDAYLAGRVSKRYVRTLFFRKVSAPGTARKLYFDIVRRVRVPRKRLVS